MAPAAGPGGVIDIGDLFNPEEEKRRLLDEIALRPSIDAKRLLSEIGIQADRDQRRFIDTTARHVRLIAPAGSGKTQSIVHRVARLIVTGYRHSNFLILTFDNAAKAALQDKFRELFSTAGLGEQPAVSTLNSFGASVLRNRLRDQYGHLSLGESQTRHYVLTGLLKQIKSDPATSEAAALLPGNLQRNVYLGLISVLKNNLIFEEAIRKRPAETKERFENLADRTRILDPWLDPLRGREDEAAARASVKNLLIKILVNYDCRMRQDGRLDFDDQKLLPYLAFLENPSLAQSVTGSVAHIIVDEFQDINYLDFELIRQLAAGKKLTVVGDDDQAIYGFRGCSPDFILDLETRLGEPIETHVLTTNYRCPRNIVEMSTRLIRHNKRRLEKNATAASQTDADVQLWHCANVASEAQILARTISRLHAEGIPLHQIAVLYRVNHQSLPLQLALILREIPYHCRKEDNYLLSNTMERILGLLRLNVQLIEDPSYRSREAVWLLCEAYFRYSSDECADRLIRKARRADSIQQAVQQLIAGRDRHFTTKFMAALKVLSAPSTPGRLIQALGEHFKNLGGLVGTLEDAIDNHVPLGELIDIAGRFKGTTSEFVGVMSPLLEKATRLYSEDEADAVNLLTYFRAKGRQWHTVFLPGANQRLIPHARSPIEDERRLFYVAVTRATGNLVLSYVRNAVRQPVERSKFLDELGVGEGIERRAQQADVRASMMWGANPGIVDRTMPELPSERSA